MASRVTSVMFLTGKDQISPSGTSELLSVKLSADNTEGPRETTANVRTSGKQHLRHSKLNEAANFYQYCPARR
jgi:hypothetical protein